MCALCHGCMVELALLLTRLCTIGAVNTVLYDTDVIWLFPSEQKGKFTDHGEKRVRNIYGIGSIQESRPSQKCITVAGWLKSVC